jgi:Secretion system C-terminal sorting domain
LTQTQCKAAYTSHTTPRNADVAVNCSAGNISLSLLSAQDIAWKLKLIDLSGKEVYSTHLGKAFEGENIYNVDVSQRANGMYIAVISGSNGQTYSEKIVVSQ